MLSVMPLRAFSTEETFHMDAETIFNPIFWALLALMLSMRTWFQFRVWRTGERLGADRAARKRDGLWAHLVAYVFFLLLVAVVAHRIFRGGSLQGFAFPAPAWLRWAGVGLGITSVGLFVWTHAVL